VSHLFLDPGLVTSPPDRWHLLLDLGKLVTSPLNRCGYPQRIIYTPSHLKIHHTGAIKANQLSLMTILVMAVLALKEIHSFDSDLEGEAVLNIQSSIREEVEYKE